MGICGLGGSKDDDANNDAIKGPAKENAINRGSQEDQVILQLKFNRDKTHGRIKELEKKKLTLVAQVKEFLGQKNKDMAKFKLKQKKMVLKQLETYQTRILFVEKQIKNVEQAVDDAAFTKLVKESNTVMKKLMEEIDLESIQTAKELNRENDMNNEELNQLIKDDDYDEELMAELDQMEAEMYGKGFQEFDAANRPVQNQDTKEPEQEPRAQKKREAEMVS
jgi:hypothetical protein